MHPKCAVCGIKKSKFLKRQEANKFLSSSAIKTPLNKVPLLNVSFWRYKNEWSCEQVFIGGDTFMPEMPLKEPGFT